MGAPVFVTAALVVLFRLLDFSNLVFGNPETTKELVVVAVERADTVLIAAALVIIGIGLYALFIGEVARLLK